MPDPFEPRSHAFLSEDILYRLRAVAEATSSALDSMLDADPQYRAGADAAVRSVGKAINLDPADEDARADPTGYHHIVHLRRDVRGILRGIFEATASTLAHGGTSDSAYLQGVTNTLEALGRALDLVPAESGLKSPPVASTARRQQATVERPQPRQLPPPVEDAYYLRARGGRVPDGLQQYLARYGISATVASGTADGQSIARVRLQGVSEARREWAEYVINRWASRDGWRVQQSTRSR